MPIQDKDDGIGADNQMSSPTSANKTSPDCVASTVASFADHLSQDLSQRKIVLSRLNQN